MTKKVLFSSLAVVGLFGIAMAVGAQGPGGPGPMGGPFGRHGRGGPGGPGGRGSAACAPSCPQYQFSFTKTTKEPVLLSTGPSVVTHTTTGTIAQDMYGSTYRDETITPWNGQGTSQEVIFVHDLDPGVMMNYLEQVTKGTYEQFAIKTPPANGSKPNWQGGPHPGKAPGKGPGGSGNGPTVTPLTNYVLDSSYTCPAAVQTTFTRGTDFSSTRIVCTTLHVLLEEDHTDPRFGSSTYELSNYAALSVFPFTPKGTLTQGHKFGPHGGKGGSPSATPQS